MLLDMVVFAEGDGIWIWMAGMFGRVWQASRRLVGMGK